jgi:hypothetical protein
LRTAEQELRNSMPDRWAALPRQHAGADSQITGTIQFDTSTSTELLACPAAS